MSAIDLGAGSRSPVIADEGPLAGVRICLVFEYSLSHYSRLLQEIAALQEAGAIVELLTSHPHPDSPPGIRRTYAPLDITIARTVSIPASQIRWRPLRIADNFARTALRWLLAHGDPRPKTRIRTAALRRLSKATDVFWVIDFPSLPTALRAAQRRGKKVVYETVDLVPEYLYQGEEFRVAQLREERRLIGNVDGFITACDGYADYYTREYADELERPPVVRDNMPAEIVEEPRRTGRFRRLLFLGSLMFDRPVLELIDAMALVESDVTLTFQGKNYLDDEPLRKINSLGLESRVQIIPPCPPHEIVQTASEYDVGIVGLRGEDVNEHCAATSKIFTYMSAGLAVLASDLPGIARVVDENDNGMLVNGMSPEAWARGIDSMAKLDFDDAASMRQRSLDGARARSWDKQKPTFIHEFTRSLGR